MGSAPPAPRGPASRPGTALGGSELFERYRFVELADDIRQVLTADGVAWPQVLGRGQTQAEKSERQQFSAEISARLDRTAIGRTIPPSDRGRVGKELATWLLGLGVLTPYFDDPEVNDVVVHGTLVDLRRNGQLVPVGHRANTAYFVELAHRICDLRNERLDRVEKSLALTDLPDGSRLMAVVPGLSQNGATLYFRRHQVRHLSLDEMVAAGTLDVEGRDFLARIAGYASIVISGAMGTGKTTLLNAITAHLPPMANVAAVETIRELQIQHERVNHIVAWNHDRAPDHALRTIINNLLTRGLIHVLIVGETTGEEATAIVEGMGLGIPAMTTTHGADPEAAIIRMEELYLAGSPNYNHIALRRALSRRVHVVVQMDRGLDGVFRVGEIATVEPYVETHGGYRIRSLKRWDADAQAFTPLEGAEELCRRLRIPQRMGDGRPARGA